MRLSDKLKSIFTSGDDYTVLQLLNKMIEEIKKYESGEHIDDGEFVSDYFYNVMPATDGNRLDLTHNNIDVRYPITIAFRTHTDDNTVPYAVQSFLLGQGSTGTRDAYDVDSAHINVDNEQYIYVQIVGNFARDIKVIYRVRTDIDTNTDFIDF